MSNTKEWLWYEYGWLKKLLILWSACEDYVEWNGLLTQSFARANAQTTQSLACRPRGSTKLQTAPFRGTKSKSPPRCTFFSTDLRLTNLGKVSSLQYLFFFHSPSIALIRFTTSFDNLFQGRVHRFSDTFWHHSASFDHQKWVKFWCLDFFLVILPASEKLFNLLNGLGMDDRLTLPHTPDFTSFGLVVGD